jgi:hypothetical protein
VISTPHRGIVERLYYADLPAVVATSYSTVEEGQITEFDSEGFRIGPLGHWVWWPQVEHVGERKR